MQPEPENWMCTPDSQVYIMWERQNVISAGGCSIMINMKVENLLWDSIAGMTEAHNGFLQGEVRTVAEKYEVIFTILIKTEESETETVR